MTTSQMIHIIGTQPGIMLPDVLPVVVGDDVCDAPLGYPAPTLPTIPPGVRTPAGPPSEAIRLDMLTPYAVDFSPGSPLVDASPV